MDGSVTTEVSPVLFLSRVWSLFIFVIMDIPLEDNNLILSLCTHTLVMPSVEE